MRVFAGPNGSGKTTIINTLKGKFKFGVYVNADDIERVLNENKVLHFDNFKLKVSETMLHSFFKLSRFSPIKRDEIDLWKKLEVIDNVLYVNSIIDSYLAADIAEFIRQQLLANDLTFTYETVMSHASKLAFLEEAKRRGYRVYLYFVATEDPEINISRVNVRVAQHGHFVNPDVIRNRYFKSLGHLKNAVKLSDRAYIFDNSSSISSLIAQITDGTHVEIIDTERVPNWFVKYLANAPDN